MTDQLPLFRIRPNSYGLFGHTVFTTWSVVEHRMPYCWEAVASFASAKSAQDWIAEETAKHAADKKGA